MPKVVKITGLVVLLLLIVSGVAFWNWQRPMLSFDDSKIPYGLVTAIPMEFEKIYAISKFRSASGHDYSYGTFDGETCRSMKHYINIGRNQDPETHMPLRSQPTVEEPNIKIFAPFDGTIDSVSQEQTPIGKQVRIRSKNYPYFYARLFHIDLLPEFKQGSEVKSNVQIATVGPKDGTDVSIEANSFKGSIYLSMFEVMTDQAFAPFSQKGYKRKDFIITKEYRDAHRLSCGGSHNNEGFVREQDYDWHIDFIFLKEDPFPEYNQGSKPIHIGPPQT